ncbi:FecR family protein [Winogradskyella sp.]|uniref:FecR family protein n=1 Tax=Winogradskyella sp. TaxID=1883156 RepID=UPI00261E2A64|nr:FecR domain-containing protein [Winogradskyella sp.]
MKKGNSHNNSETFLAKWLDGELTDKALENLVSKEDYAAYLKLRSGLRVNEQLNASVDGSFAEIQKRIINKTNKVRPLYLNWAIGIAASIIVLFGVFTFLNNNEVIVETGYGESRTIVLLDGSEVILNAKSVISYDENNWENDRKLFLEGEAYFKVAKGKTFIVETDFGSVSVLGTQFNVNATEDFFDVICYEGKVGVKTLESDRILLANDAVRYVGGKSIEVAQGSDKIPTWIHGESTFKSVPLRYVIKALENQYQVSFDASAINDSEIFTGSFPNDSLNIALKTVFQTLNITYNEKEKRNIKLRYKE